MMHLKTCPRCRGDVQECADQYGPYLRCCQCGWYQDVKLFQAIAYPVQQRRRREDELPRLPVTPSNYLPWRERERGPWEAEADQPCLT